ncbi:TPA: hypothetical protein PRY50_002601 [Escherichia coli]|nr:hypothetical protein [Escherichia coli]
MFGTHVNNTGNIRRLRITRAG